MDAVKLQVQDTRKVLVSGEEVFEEILYVNGTPIKESDVKDSMVLMVSKVLKAVEKDGKVSEVTAGIDEEVGEEVIFVNGTPIKESDAVGLATMAEVIIRATGRYVIYLPDKEEVDMYTA